MSSSKGNQGFTLIEVIVSILFLSITLAGLVTTYAYMASRMETMRWKRSALRWSQEIMEEWIANPETEPEYTTDPRVETLLGKDEGNIKLTATNNTDRPYRHIRCEIRMPGQTSVSVSLDTIVSTR